MQALIATGADCLESSIEPDLVEQNFGGWHGKTYDYLEHHDSAYRVFWDDPTNATPPGGEAFCAVVVRVHNAILRLTRYHEGRDIVVIAHAGPIRAAIGLALGLDADAMLRCQIDPLSLTRLDHFAAPSWSVVTVNRTIPNDERETAACRMS